MHLTNYSINKMSEDFAKVQAEDVLSDTQGTKRTITALYRSLEKNGIDIDTVRENIATTCGKIMQIYGPMLQH
jgi:hypothetical protein